VQIRRGESTIKRRARSAAICHPDGFHAEGNGLLAEGKQKFEGMP
jgi:hypothetical protein